PAAPAAASTTATAAATSGPAAAAAWCSVADPVRGFRRDERSGADGTVPDGALSDGALSDGSGALADADDGTHEQRPTVYRSNRPRADGRGREQRPTVYRSNRRGADGRRRDHGRDRFHRRSVQRSLLAAWHE